MITQDAFNKEFESLLASLELRRKRYLKLFCLNTAIAAALVYVSFAYPAEILVFIIDFFEVIGQKTHLFKMKETLDAASQIKESDVYALIFTAVMAAGFLILTPIYRYRGTNRSAALQTFRYHRFSLKDEAYSKLFKLLGGFEFAPRGEISFLETRESTLFPEHKLFLSEDLVVGRLNDITVKFCEANVIKVHEKERFSVFRGLLIVCDISELKVKLRSNFRGRTVLVYDPKKNVAEYTAKNPTMQRLPLPYKFERTLEGYTTDAEEASRIITTELLDCLDKLAAYTESLIDQVTHWDDRLAHASHEVYDYIKETLTSLVGKARLPVEVAYDKEYKTGLDITKSDPLANDPTSSHKHFELEFYDDKFIVTIPCKFDLFETNSIFEPSLNYEDAELVYLIVQTLEKITQHLSHVKN